jgi:tRNA A37 threonylcarbamoyladenosine modification protein TsaB
MHDLLVIALSSPILVGVYEDGRLIKTIETEEKSSEALPEIIQELLDSYDFSHLVYANGPGSFMAIKVTYLFLKTVSITKNVPLLARDAFYFNDNTPIKAVGKLFFVKNSDTITTQTFDTAPAGSFRLPEKLCLEDFEEETVPHYGIGAV